MGDGGAQLRSREPRAPEPRFPGPKSRALLAEFGRYVVADPFPFVLEPGACHGMTLTTVDGDTVTDWGGFFASKLIGPGHPRLATAEYGEAVARVTGLRVPSPDYLTAECVAYYRLLHRIAPRCLRGPGLEVYVVNSGAEAVENGLKYLIVRFEAEARRAGRTPSQRRFLHFERAFHGRTLAALNVTRLTHDPVVTRDFRGMIPGNLELPFPHYDSSRSDAENEAEVHRCVAAVESALSAHPGEIVGIVVEPLQGAGGHRVALPRFFQELSRLAHEHAVGLAFDEVQTAGGPCGDVFVVDQLELPYPPDVVATAKKFGNGVVFMRQVLDDQGVLDSTWGGSLVDMVRFCAEWAVVEEERLIEKVPIKAARLHQGLRAVIERHPARAFNVRGLGLYQGFSLREPAHKAPFIDAALQEDGVLFLGAGHQTIRLRPTLDVTEAEIDAVVAVVERGLERLVERG